MNRQRLLCSMTAIAAGLCMASGAAAASESDRYTITGDLSAAYSNGEFVVWVSEPRNGSGGATGMVAAVSAAGGGGSRTGIKDGLNVVAEAPVIDGKFVLEGAAPAPRNVFFYVLNATGSNGMRMAPIKGQSFILEPGSLTLTMDSRAKFVVRGGHYNDIVINSWRLSPEYLELMDAYNQSVRAVEGETEQQRRGRVERSSELFNGMLQLENEGRGEVALNHEDPLARKLTIQSAWLRGPWMTQASLELAKMMPDDPWVQQNLASEEQYSANRARSAAFAVGAGIKDFEAETLDGEIVSVSGAREGKEIVLVEFWASWCGPCRVEIPHMKQAYEDYGPRGFEIFSFTVDDEREDWVEASEEEGLPWINAGMGLDHPAAKTYGVTGVPANFLVDAPSGEIIARDLRGHKLDEALAKRFGNTSGPH